MKLRLKLHKTQTDEHTVESSVSATNKDFLQPIILIILKAFPKIHPSTNTYFFFYEKSMKTNHMLGETEAGPRLRGWRHSPAALTVRKYIRLFLTSRKDHLIGSFSIHKTSVRICSHWTRYLSLIWKVKSYLYFC